MAGFPVGFPVSISHSELCIQWQHFTLSIEGAGAHSASAERSERRHEKVECQSTVLCRQFTQMILPLSSMLMATTFCTKRRPAHVDHLHTAQCGKESGTTIEALIEVRRRPWGDKMLLKKSTEKSEKSTCNAKLGAQISRGLRIPRPRSLLGSTGGQDDPPA